jgi:hypothetical protein
MNYNDRSWNVVNDHYDSSVNYDKMYGALVQKQKSAEDSFPEYLTMGPFASARINQEVPRSSYFPYAN